MFFSTKRAWQSGSKRFKRWYMGKLRQTMVDSWYCLDLVIPERMSQVSRQLEVGKHKQRTLNTRLFSGTSAGTFECRAGPYRNCRSEAGTKNEPKLYFVPNQKKDPKIDPHVSNQKSREFLFSEGSGPPLIGSSKMKKEREKATSKPPPRGPRGGFSIYYVQWAVCKRFHDEMRLSSRREISYTRLLIREHSRRISSWNLWHTALDQGT